MARYTLNPSSLLELSDQARLIDEEVLVVAMRFVGADGALKVYVSTVARRLKRNPLVPVAYTAPISKVLVEVLKRLSEAKVVVASCTGVVEEARP